MDKLYYAMLENGKELKFKINEVKVVGETDTIIKVERNDTYRTIIKKETIDNGVFFTTPKGAIDDYLVKINARIQGLHDEIEKTNAIRNQVIYYKYNK